MTEIFEVFLLSMTPIGELRLSIPMGLAVYHLDTALVFFVSVIGNMIPAIFFVLFLDRLFNFLSQRYAFFNKFFSWWKNKNEKKHLEKLQKYGAVGLFVFVATPLPLTGVWSAALLSSVLKLPVKKSLCAIFLGVLIAGIFATAITLGGINIEKYFGWQALVVTILVALAGYFCYKIIKK